MLLRSCYQSQVSPIPAEALNLQSKEGYINNAIQEACYQTVKPQISSLRVNSIEPIRYPSLWRIQGFLMLKIRLYRNFRSQK